MADEKLLGARVLVLGGAGFLGARIVRKLCYAGITPHLLLRSTGRMGRIEDLAQSCNIHIGDLTDLESVQQIIDRVRPDVLFHAAGYGSHKGQNSRESIFHSNLLATHHLLIAIERVPDCRIIFSGTSLEQGMKNKPLQETGSPDPMSFYAATKTAALVLVRQAARHEKRPITILTPFAIYGPGEPATRLIPTAIRAGMEKQTLPLTQPGFVRDFVFVDDVADAYLAAATNDRVLGEDIHIACGKPVSNENVVELIEAQLGKSINKQVGAYPPRATDTTFWCADINKARELLGWEPSHSLEQGLKSTIDWFGQNGFRF